MQEYNLFERKEY